MQTAVVWSCLLFIRSGQNHLARHTAQWKREEDKADRRSGRKTRQTEEEAGRQGRQGKRQEDKADRGRGRKMRQTEEEAGRQGRQRKRQEDKVAVSYTHLTLPTKLSV